MTVQRSTDSIVYHLANLWRTVENFTAMLYTYNCTWQQAGVRTLAVTQQLYVHSLSTYMYQYVPYSAKFSRHLYFVDWPLKAISLHNVRGMTAYRKPRL